MPLLFGLAMMALGGSLALVWWTPAFIAALQVCLVCALLLGGLVLVLVGYSELKARRDFSAEREENPAPNSHDIPEEVA